MSLLFATTPDGAGRYIDWILNGLVWTLSLAFGAWVIALVVGTPVADKQVIDWCAERGIPLARIFLVDTLPKTASGKIHRDLLKRQLLH